LALFSVVGLMEMALVALKLDDLGKAWRDHGVDSPIVPLNNAGNSQCLHW